MLRPAQVGNTVAIDKVYRSVGYRPTMAPSSLIGGTSRAAPVSLSFNCSPQGSRSCRQGAPAVGIESLRARRAQIPRSARQAGWRFAGPRRGCLAASASPPTWNWPSRPSRNSSKSLLGARWVRTPQSALLVCAVAIIAFGGLRSAPSFPLLNLPASFLAVAFAGQRLLDAEFLARL
jgi:hypothetical protein